MEEKKYRVIQIMRDPHIVFIKDNGTKYTELCEYRVLVEGSDGDVMLISAQKCDLNGTMTAEELYFQGNDYEECNECSPEIVANSAIKRWWPGLRLFGEEATPQDVLNLIIAEFEVTGLKETSELRDKASKILRGHYGDNQ